MSPVSRVTQPSHDAGLGSQRQVPDEPGVHFTSEHASNVGHSHVASTLSSYLQQCTHLKVGDTQQNGSDIYPKKKAVMHEKVVETSSCAADDSSRRRVFFVERVPPSPLQRPRLAQAGGVRLPQPAAWCRLSSEPGSARHRPRACRPAQGRPTTLAAQPAATGSAWAQPAGCYCNTRTNQGCHLSVGERGVVSQSVSRSAPTRAERSASTPPSAGTS